MAYQSIFEYIKGMTILVDKEARKDLDITENLDKLDEDDLKAFKFIYEHELVTVNLVDVHKRKANFGDYSFKNRIKLYQEYELLDSYYVKAQNGERLVNMFMLTDKVAACIKERFGLKENTGEFHEFIKENNVLGFLKKMALNQFLICSVNVKDYQIVKGKMYDAIIEYNDEPIEYYVKVVRYTGEEIASVKDAIRYVEDEVTGKRAMLLLCEYGDLIVDVGLSLKGIKTKIGVYYQTDIGALNSPEKFKEVEVLDKEHYSLYAIKRTQLHN